MFKLLRVDNQGVSPVVGVILVVAITVILSAVIGSFVIDLGDSVSQSGTAGVQVVENADGSVTTQLTALGENTESVKILVDGNEVAEFSEIGATHIFGGSGDVSIVAVSNSGSETVIQSNAGTVDSGAATISADGDTIDITIVS